MTGKRVIKADVFRGPFDPGGQPDLTPRNPLELSFFAWNVRGGLSATKAVMSDPARYRDYWHWPTAKRLLAEADRIGFDYQVQYGMWGGYGGASGWNDARTSRSGLTKTKAPFNLPRHASKSLSEVIVTTTASPVIVPGVPGVQANG